MAPIADEKVTRRCNRRPRKVILIAEQGLGFEYESELDELTGTKQENCGNMSIDSNVDFAELSLTTSDVFELLSRQILRSCGYGMENLLLNH